MPSSSNPRNNAAPTTPSSNPFGLPYIVFYILLSLCMGIGLLAIHILVPSDSQRFVLEGIFIVATLLIAGTQLVIQWTFLSRFWSPLKQCLNDIHTRHQQFEQAQIAEQHGSLQKTQRQAMHCASHLAKQYPHEVQELHTIFVRQMHLLEEYAKTAEEQSNLAVMGQICAQVAHDMRSPLTMLRVFLQHRDLCVNDNGMLVHGKAIALQS